MNEMMMKNTLMDALGMEVIKAEPDCVEMRMPVDARTHQPMGFLHGGANVALAESAASIGGFLNIDTNEQQVFGLEINANHIKSAREGYVTAAAVPAHIGKTTMVWEIRIVHENGTLLCLSRCTLGVVPLKK
ncbi:hotdog fold thioesterase [Halobacillus litoralis]|uniref:Hotdog fold thioesterase n=2 Tax=Bacillaceae TaxID=186817 RepID=A0A845DXY4_9BACI|nr:MULTISPECIES: hotdog fold thioesterase [Halobacillus]MYL21162.1 hotdog fold thioesterase [Halobacillus litoralis]MYL31304.1 hotdog fold thioesterase [Halobacillus halophilus]MYL38544.1 hotdog fold thioesterase [Halobacillus litoralis]